MLLCQFTDRLFRMLRTKDIRHTNIRQTVLQKQRQYWLPRTHILSHDSQLKAGLVFLKQKYYVKRGSYVVFYDPRNRKTFMLLQQGTDYNSCFHDIPRKCIKVSLKIIRYFHFEQHDKQNRKRIREQPKIFVTIHRTPCIQAHSTPKNHQPRTTFALLTQRIQTIFPPQWLIRLTFYTWRTNVGA